MSRRAVTTLVLCVVLVTSACAASNRSSNAASTATTQHTDTFVVLGSGATVGDGLTQPLQEAWPRLVYREALPRATVFVNTAVEGATVASALRDQVPLAEQLHPSVIAVWLGLVEAIDAEPVARFTTEFRELLAPLAETGARIFVADLPQVTSVDLRPYNTVIHRFADEFGATIVPLATRQLTSLSRAGPYFPDKSGHRAIADAFEAAMKNTR